MAVSRQPSQHPPDHQLRPAWRGSSAYAAACASASFSNRLPRPATGLRRWSREPSHQAVRPCQQKRVPAQLSLSARSHGVRRRGQRPLIGNSRSFERHASQHLGSSESRDALPSPAWREHLRRQLQSPQSEMLFAIPETHPHAQPTADGLLQPVPWPRPTRLTSCKHAPARESGWALHAKAGRGLQKLWPFFMGLRAAGLILLFSCHSP